MVEEMIYAKSENYTLYKGDCLDLLKQLPDESIDCIITSPPYNIDLKNRKDTNIAHYDNYNDNMSWKEYVDWQVQIVNECERVLKWGGYYFTIIKINSKRKYTGIQ